METALSHIKENLVDNVVMIKVSTKAQAFISKRVKRGKYLKGSTGGKEYSTTPMPIPYGAFVKKFGKKTLEEDEFSIYRSKSGNTMIVIENGYKKYREMSGKSSDKVNMHWSGRMMQNLGILRSDHTSAELGFSSESEREKAYYQHIGAGKNKITRKFMGLTKKETNKLADYAEKLIIQNITK